MKLNNEQSPLTIADHILSGNFNINPTPPASTLKAMEAAEWIKVAEATPIPKMLCHQLWYEGELCFMFADTNVGKSILAVQIADNISRGRSDGLFITQAAKQKVLYLDFELSAKQFQGRYSSNFEFPYNFDKNLIRVELCLEGVVHDFEMTLFRDIEKLVKQHDARVLIVDNITYLKTQSTDTAREALPLMNMLINLKRKYNLSILVLAHTPKRNNANPITINDMAGSKHISNFADSVFAIGLSSQGNNLRYIKQLKARSTEKLFDTNYVMVCEIKKDVNFLRFNQLECEPEHLHLQQGEATETAQMENAVVDVYKENPDLSMREIGRRAGMDHRKARRILQRRGLVD